MLLKLLLSQSNALWIIHLNLSQHDRAAKTKELLFFFFLILSHSRRDQSLFKCTNLNTAVGYTVLTGGAVKEAVLTISSCLIASLGGEKKMPLVVVEP